jgi:hypothetical protein
MTLPPWIAKTQVQPHPYQCIKILFLKLNIICFVIILYDLEGTVDQFSDWRDFFLGSEETNETLTALHRRGYSARR